MGDPNELMSSPDQLASMPAEVETPNIIQSQTEAPASVVDPVEEAKRAASSGKPLTIDQGIILNNIPVGDPIPARDIRTNTTTTTTRSWSGRTAEAKKAAEEALTARKLEAQAVQDGGREVEAAVREVSAHHADLAAKLQEQQAELAAIEERGQAEIQKQTDAVMKARDEAKRAAAALNPNRLLGGIGGAVRMLGALFGGANAVNQYAKTGQVRQNAALEMLNRQLEQDFEKQMAVLGAKQNEQTFEQNLLKEIRLNVTERRNVKAAYIGTMKEIAGEKLLELQSNVDAAKGVASTVAGAQKIIADGRAQYEQSAAQDRVSKQTTTNTAIVHQQAQQMTYLQAATNASEEVAKYNKGVPGISEQAEGAQVRSIQDVTKNNIEPLVLSLEVEKALGEMSRLKRLGFSDDAAEYKQWKDIITDSFGRAITGANMPESEQDNFTRQIFGPNNTLRDPDAVRRALTTFRRAMVAKAHASIVSNTKRKEDIPAQMEQVTRALPPALRESVASGRYIGSDAVQKRANFTPAAAPGKGKGGHQGSGARARARR